MDRVNPCPRPRSKSCVLMSFVLLALDKTEERGVSEGDVSGTDFNSAPSYRSLRPKDTPVASGKEMNYSIPLFYFQIKRELICFTSPRVGPAYTVRRHPVLEIENKEIRSLTLKVEYPF